MKKITDIEKQIRDLKLNLIEVQTQKELATPMEFEIAVGYTSPAYKTIYQLENEEKSLKNQIAFLEGEGQAAEASPKKGKPAGGLEHEKVKAEAEKVRKKKKIPEGQRVDEILEEVAEKLGKKFEATKKAYYYKPK